VTAQKPTVSLAESVAVDGSTSTLVCTTPSNIAGAAVAYKWYRDADGSTPISGKTAMQYALTVAFDSADNYKCSVDLLGTESALSDPYALSGPVCLLSKGML